MVLTLAAVSVTVAPASGARDAAGSATGNHCMAKIVDQRSDGELVTEKPVCFATFSEAMSYASDGAVKLDADTPGSAVFEDEVVGPLADQFTLGIHFDLYGGYGLSIGIVGTICNGGYWNALGWWSNRVSSSFNGCHHLRHYDEASRVGSYFDTWTGGQIDNIATWFNNRTESVAYLAS